MKKNCYLSYGNVWKYALVALAVIFIWTSVFGALGQIKDNQRLSVSIYNTEFDTEPLRDELVRVLPELTKQEILELYVGTFESYPGQTYADDILTAQILRSDLVIMPKPLLDKLEITVFFKELPAEIDGKYASNGYYTVDGKHYGILIGDGTVFSHYCESDEPLYILLSDYSSNLAGLYGRGEAEDDAALVTLYYLLEEAGK